MSIPQNMECKALLVHMPMTVSTPCHGLVRHSKGCHSHKRSYPGATKDVPLVYLEVLTKLLYIFDKIPCRVFIRTSASVK